ncbi:MAG: fucose isomerase [Lachnospiraceae bacterium]|nr:fucose isomerase [Lachnospiraceae bacterium]
MKNIPDIKLAIIAGSTDWLPGDVAVESRKKLIETYKNLYGENGIYGCSVVIDDNEINIKRAMREIKKAECNAVCLYWSNYGPESAGTIFAEEFDGPVMMIAAAEEGEAPYTRGRKDSLSGFINACYALKLRQTNVYIPSKPCGTLEECSGMINDFLTIAKTVIAVNNLKIISIGPRPSSYLAASAPEHLLYDMGVDISEYSELELLNSFTKHSDDQRKEKIIKSMTEELTDNKTPEILDKLAQFELTLDDWIRNHKGNRKYVALTSTCWPAFPVSFGFVPCYVHSRLAEKGYPVACEVDVYGALSEYIGQCISDDVVTILNINNNIPLELYKQEIEGKEFNGKYYEIGDLFLGYHCGVTSACKLTKSTLDYHFVNCQLIGEEHSKGTIQGTIRPGGVTIFRIQGTRDNRLRAYVCQGQILPVDEDTYGGKAIIAIPEMERFIRNVLLEKQFPNHCAVIFGHYGETLIAALQQLGIKEIYYNQPKNIPYEKENVFSTLDNYY